MSTWRLHRKGRQGKIVGFQVSSLFHCHLLLRLPVYRHNESNLLDYLAMIGLKA